MIDQVQLLKTVSHIHQLYNLILPVPVRVLPCSIVLRERAPPSWPPRSASLPTVPCFGRNCATSPAAISIYYSTFRRHTLPRTSRFGVKVRAAGNGCGRYFSMELSRSSRVRSSFREYLSNHRPARNKDSHYWILHTHKKQPDGHKHPQHPNIALCNSS